MAPPPPPARRPPLTWPPSQWDKRDWLIAGLCAFGIGIVGTISDQEKASPRPAAPPTLSAEQVAAKAKAEEDRRNARHCRSNWDGSPLKVVDAVKKTLRDPNSFEHDDTRITPVDQAGHNRVVMKYRAKNGFGGMNIGYAAATIDNRTCDVLSLVSADD